MMQYLEMIRFFNFKISLSNNITNNGSEPYSAEILLKLESKKISMKMSVEIFKRLV